MGLQARIAYQEQKGFLSKIIRSLKKVIDTCNSDVNYDWLDFFKGNLHVFNELDEISFSRNEIAVAVGSKFIGELLSRRDIGHRIAFCHGLPGRDIDLSTSNWRYSIPTILVSENLRDPLLRLANRPILGVVPNGIDHKLYYPRNIEKNGIGILYSTSYEKAPEFTLELINELAKNFSDKPIYIFSRERKPMLPSNARYFRYAAPLLTAEIYNRCQLWLVASRREGFGLPIIEAMACGTPVISTATEGATFLIKDMNNGIICKNAIVKDFTAAIINVLGAPDLYQKLIRNGISTAEKFNWHDTAKKFLDVLSEEVSDASR
jgi:glycosyltransferase involved in cell wall biosynthesis